MAITLTDQFVAPPPATPGGDDWLADGEGLHTAFSRDLPTTLNNLATYCNPWAQYVQTCNVSAAGSHTMTPNVSGEFLIFQVPIVIPIGAQRMLWTAGIVKTSGTGNINACTVYLSKTEYTKTAQADPFDILGLSPHSIPGSKHQGNGQTVFSAAPFFQTITANGYTLVSELDIGVQRLSSVAVARRSGTGLTYLANLILTLTTDGRSPPSIVMGVADFTCWFKFE